MSRTYDHGLNHYKAVHKAHSGQHTKHTLSNELLGHYGAKASNYQQWSHNNYTMGSSKSNGIDTRIDNRLINHVFQGVQYDAYELAQNGVTYTQQLNALGKRFDAAKDAYATTGEYKYFMIQKDFKQVAQDHLNADGRQFRLSNK